MTRITVKLIGPLAGRAGRREYIIDLAPGRPTVAELLAELDRMTNGRLGGDLYQAGDRQQLNKSNLFLINGREARFMSGLQTHLEEGAIVTLMPMLVGG